MSLRQLLGAFGLFLAALLLVGCSVGSGASVEMDAAIAGPAEEAEDEDGEAEDDTDAQADAIEMAVRTIYSLITDPPQDYDESVAITVANWTPQQLTFSGTECSHGHFEDDGDSATAAGQIPPATLKNGSIAPGVVAALANPNHGAGGDTRVECDIRMENSNFTKGFSINWDDDDGSDFSLSDPVGTTAQPGAWNTSLRLARLTYSTATAPTDQTDELLYVQIGQPPACYSTIEDSGLRDNFWNCPLPSTSGLEFQAVDTIAPDIQSIVATGGGNNPPAAPLVATGSTVLDAGSVNRQQPPITPGQKITVDLSGPVNGQYYCLPSNPAFLTLISAHPGDDECTFIGTYQVSDDVGSGGILNIPLIRASTLQPDPGAALILTNPVPPMVVTTANLDRVQSTYPGGTIAVDLSQGPQAGKLCLPATGTLEPIFEVAPDVPAGQCVTSGKYILKLNVSPGKYTIMASQNGFNSSGVGILFEVD